MKKRNKEEKENLKGRLSKAVTEESMTHQSRMVSFCLPLETYHILLSSITSLFYNLKIFEQWKQADSKN